MKKLISAMTLVVILLLSLSTMTYARELDVVSTVSPSSQVTTIYSELDIAINKRLYENYKKGITTTVIGLQNAGDIIIIEDGPISEAADLMITEKEIVEDGNKTKLTITVDTLQQAKNSHELEEELDKLVAEANKYSTLREKLAYINDTIVETTVYAWSGDYNRYTCAEGALVDKTANCSGYSDAVHEICERLGIPWTYIYGYNHRSTMVYIDGQWYAWDLTWNCVGRDRMDIEVVADVIINPNGGSTIVSEPAKRKYFLLPMGSSRFNKYIQEMRPSSDNLGLNEIVLSILHPDKATIDISLDKWEIDPSNITEQKNESSYIDNAYTDYSDVKVIMGKPTSSAVYVNGRKIDFGAYNIEGNNYFKLRDLAMALRGTDKQFEVGWDGKNNAISITTGKMYTPVGGELQPIKYDESYAIDSKGNLIVVQKKSDKVAVPTSSKIFLNGKEVQFTAYKIDGNNYFKLRDVGQAINFGVEYDSKTKAISIDTNSEYN